MRDSNVTFTNLDANEQHAFVALVRLMIRADGRFTAPEVDALMRLAERLGRPRFWSLMNESVSLFPTRQDVLRLAGAVERLQVRAWIVRTLTDLAAVDGVHPREDDLLEQLTYLWHRQAP